MTESKPLGHSAELSFTPSPLDVVCHYLHGTIVSPTECIRITTPTRGANRATLRRVEAEQRRKARAEQRLLAEAAAVEGTWHGSAFTFR